MSKVGITSTLTMWSAKELADHLKTKGFGEYHETFISYDVTGRLAVQLNDAKLEEMGIRSADDRAKIINVLVKELKNPEKVLLQRKGIKTCSSYTYTLTTANLKLQHKTRQRLRCCFGLEAIQEETIALSKVSSVESSTFKAPRFLRIFYGGETVEKIRISHENKRVIHMWIVGTNGKDKEFADKIRVQVKVVENQRMERAR